MAKSITTIGLTKLASDALKDVDKFAEKTTRAAVFRATAKVKKATPVDTGAARNAWWTGYTPTYFDTAEPPDGKGESNPQAELNVLKPLDKPQRIYVTNGVQYIQDLNEGNSKQAPAKFIESAFEEEFEEVRVEYKTRI